jgi:hypothetical protein
MNSILKALQEEMLVAATGQDAIDAIKKATESGVFYAEVVQTQAGQFSMGSSAVTVDGEEVDVPCVYATEDEVMACIQEEQDRYAEEIESGDRDDDDEYEGELMLVKWDGGDNMSFHCPHTQAECESGDWKWHAGI